MNGSEILSLLKAINQTDSRVSVDADRAAAWLAIIPSQVTFEVGMKAVVSHYRNSTNAMMPADLVAFYKSWRESQPLKGVGSHTSPKRVPMPEWFRAAVSDVRSGVKASNGDPVSIGQIFQSAMQLSDPKTVDDPDDAHCRRNGCACTHTDPCYRGWLDMPNGTGPCQTCRSELWSALRYLPPPGERGEHDYATLRNRGKE